jgi:hypothetical protein
MQREDEHLARDFERVTVTVAAILVSRTGTVARSTAQ